MAFVSDTSLRASAPPGASEPDAHATRERILFAAAECFAKSGFKRARMTAVADQAGVSRACLYTYFGTKRALLLALNDYVIEDWLAFCRQTLGRGVRAPDAISAWLREGLSSEARLAAVRVVTADESQNPLLGDHGAREIALREARDMLIAVLERGIEQGDLAADLDVDATANDLTALYLGLLRNHVSARPLVEVRSKTEIDALTRLVVVGLAARISPQPIEGAAHD
jgi:AcrR family transcriptional regulator